MPQPRASLLSIFFPTLPLAKRSVWLHTIFGVNALFIIIAAAIVLLAALVALFVWALRDNQFEDLENPGRRILLEDMNEQSESRH